MLFWFQTTFVSDEKEQLTHIIGVDLHYGRPARHLQQLLRDAPIADSPAVAYPDATTISQTQAYGLAREEAVRAITVAAHKRLANLQRFLQRETQRISTYFADLREELDERRERALSRAAEAQTFDDQRAALDREEQAQLIELRRKMALHAQVKLFNVLNVIQANVVAISNTAGQVLCTVCTRAALTQGKKR